MGHHELDDLLDRLDIEKDNFRVLGLLPLVHVGWADGRLQIAERAVIRRFGDEKGWLGGNADAVLSQWLAEPPAKEDILQGIHTFAALAREDRGLGASVPIQVLPSIILACREVAAASGGMFGLRPPICEEEEIALQQVTDGIAIAPGKPWQEVMAMLDEAARENEAPGSLGQVLIGKARELLRNPIELIVSSWRRFGDVSKIKAGLNTAHLVVHPDDVKHVLVDNSRNYVRDEVAFRELERLLGEGLLTTDGEAWRRKRRIMQPAFHVQKIHAMATDMAAVTSTILASWKAVADNKLSIDIAAEMGRLTLQIAGRALFHTDTESDQTAFGIALPILLRHMAHRARAVIRLPEAIPTAGNRRFRDALDRLNAIVRSTIEDRRRAPAGHHDVLSLLMDAQDEETGKGLSDEELRTEVLTLFIAGQETSATGLSWTFYQLSKNPLAARELHAEVDRVLCGRNPTIEDIPKLTYTKAVIEESMRLYPPAWLLFRKAIGEDRVSDHVLPAGSTVWLSPYLTHRHPAFWKNPEGFDPTRFLPEQSAGRHPFAYLPFGGGPRKCIGFAFAMLEMQIALAMITQAYRLELVPGYQPEIEAGFTLRPRDGIWMTVHAV
jgi:cytochrome P450